MTLLLVPGEVASDSVQLWFGALDDPAVQPASLAISVVGVPGSTPSSAIGTGRSAVVPAASRTGASRSAASCRVAATASSCDGTGSSSATRSPRRSRSTCRAWTSGRSADHARIVFRTVLRTARGMPDAPIRTLPADARADLKILCGDQVYLDQPTTEFLGHTHNADQLRERHLGNYAGTRGARPVVSASCCGSVAPTSARTTTTSGTTPRTRRSSPATRGSSRDATTGRRPRRRSMGRSSVPSRRPLPRSRSGSCRSSSQTPASTGPPNVTPSDRRPACQDRRVAYGPSTVRAAWSSASSCSRAGPASSVAGWNLGPRRLQAVPPACRGPFGGEKLRRDPDR